MNALHLALPCSIAAGSLMAVTWLISCRKDNAGWVDVAWSYSFSLMAGLAAALGAAPLPRKFLLLAMILAWSLRLGTYLALRVGRHAGEDPRYAALRTQFPNRPWTMFFFFFQAQAFLATLLAAPFFVAFANPAPALSPLEIAGALLWITAFCGESLSDAQLAAFRADPENRGKVCDRGLWKYSRHPNYFFEWTIWCSFGVFALGSPHGWVGIFPPISMYFLLTKVTGIPPAEAQSLKSRGDAYREYQKRTSPFFPLPPRGAST